VRRRSWCSSWARAAARRSCMPCTGSNTLNGLKVASSSARRHVHAQMRANVTRERTNMRETLIGRRTHVHTHADTGARRRKRWPRWVDARYHTHACAHPYIHTGERGGEGVGDGRHRPVGLTMAAMGGCCSLGSAALDAPPQAAGSAADDTDRVSRSVLPAHVPHGARHAGLSVVGGRHRSQACATPHSHTKRRRERERERETCTRTYTCTYTQAHVHSGREVGADAVDAGLVEKSCWMTAAHCGTWRRPSLSVRSERPSTLFSPRGA
jgi:hypothetical protein